MLGEAGVAGEWVLALDGGGTKTALALASCRGAVVVLPEGPGCSPQDGDGWQAVLAGALGAARRAAGGAGGIAAAAFGIPGRGEVPAHDRAVDAALARGLGGPFEAMNDVALAHRGAFGGGEGVLLLSGTGSMAWARGPAGQARVGGWGDVFGDEGSAFWIGREALALVSRMIDGREPPDEGFLAAVLGRLGPAAEGPFAPLAWAMGQGAPRAAVAGLAREVDALAEAGQVAAAACLDRAAEELAGLARAAARRAGLGERFPWVAAGGVLRSRTAMAGIAGRIGAPVAGRLTTLGGGLLRATEIAGWGVDEEWAAQADARLRALG